MSKDCILFDEREPLSSRGKMAVLKVGKDGFKLDESFNLRHKRSQENIWIPIDQVKYVALEGSSLTLLGLIKYNAGSDQFNMTELSGILSGGIMEAKRALSEKLDMYQEQMNSCIILGVSLLGLSFGLHYLRVWQDKRNKSIVEVITDPVDKPQAEGGKGSSECFICME